MTHPDPESHPAVNGRTVLLVEDSAVQRADLRDRLTGLGFRHLHEARHGLEGLAVLARVPDIDLVITDLEMPQMDGVTFIGELAARGYRPALVILSSQEASVLHAVRLMAQTYGLAAPAALAKPLDPARLLTHLRSLTQPTPAPVAAPTWIPAPDDLRKGLREGEFLCFFQPQVTLQGTRFCGVEALVRWRHPGQGLLGPAAFLPMAEAEEDLMADLTLAILAFVGRQWHEWARRGLVLEVSVNLSARSLSQAGFADRLMKAADAAGLQPRHLVFEVTESASVSHLGHTLANLTRLRMRGFRLSIDDFGTGYATFEQLERIPFTELKLDRSVVANLPGSERHMALARRLLELARDLKLATVAEGIETLETWRALRSLGCDRAQGYLIGRPMPSEQVGAWVQQDRAFLRD